LRGMFVATTLAPHASAGEQSYVVGGIASLLSQ